MADQGVLFRALLKSGSLPEHGLCRAQNGGSKNTDPGKALSKCNRVYLALLLSRLMHLMASPCRKLATML